jgi:hypothetical protein
MSTQPDLFEPASPIVGLHVKLDRPVDRDLPCHSNICVIGHGKGPHAGALHCADCGRHRGWISKASADWLLSITNRFGSPSSAIVVRSAHIYQGE